MTADATRVGPHAIYAGDCIEVMNQLEAESVSAIVCDPPYGLGFMGKAWDDMPPGEPWARECLRVLKPGGHLVAFGGTRTVHRLTCAVEDAGFEIRDMISWLYFQGFPKSLNVSKAIDKAAGAEREVTGRQKLTGTARRGVDGSSHGAARTNAADHKERLPTTINLTAPATEDAKRWAGYGTALKPSQEIACLARKPLAKGLTVAANVLKWGTGALNIDGCRYAYGDPAWPGPQDVEHHRSAGADHRGLPQQVPAGDRPPNDHPDSVRYASAGRWPANIYACPKAARSEREAGCEDLEPVTQAEAVERTPGSAGASNPRAGANRERGPTAYATYNDDRVYASPMGVRVCNVCGRRSDAGPSRPWPTCGHGNFSWDAPSTAPEPVRNHHPTVKPINLMAWLCRLVTPPGGLVLDPFLGSGTTLLAAQEEGLRGIGIELDPEYVKIATARLQDATRQGRLF